ncbi:hypothetical protein BRYFOR_05735 [Marvinbryantia formatexigens DSM 14469]|uniref:Uncharacterized protein n=1 Tax=Marvinbryantia formatexigens DSM 14469 TaxID=478749 RepID=C6LAU1_9FIRM|nr:hypothetical protein BRYFOR_05735 [Marvinbryantia formatexigens DSM 14469]
MEFYLFIINFLILFYYRILCIASDQDKVPGKFINEAMEIRVTIQLAYPCQYIFFSIVS